MDHRLPDPWHAVTFGTGAVDPGDVRGLLVPQHDRPRGAVRLHRVGRALHLGVINQKNVRWSLVHPVFHTKFG